MRQFLYFISLACIGTAVLYASFSTANGSSKMDREEVEEIVRDFLMNNPEVIAEATRKYQEKERAERESKTQEAVKKFAGAIRNDDNAPYAGKKDGSAVIVEFFDYRCGYCKKMQPAINEMIENDKDLKIVFKEMPILSKDSETAARIALSVHNIDPKKYFDAHNIFMMHKGDFTEEMLLDEIAPLGLSRSKVKEGMNSAAVNKEIDNARQMAENIGIRGTPAFIVGDELMPGAVPVDRLLEGVKEQRKN